MTIVLIILICVGYIIIAAIFGALLNYYYPAEDNILLIIMWPLTLLSIPLIFTYLCVYKLVTYLLKKLHEIH